MSQDPRPSVGRGPRAKELRDHVPGVLVRGRRTLRRSVPDLRRTPRHRGAPEVCGKERSLTSRELGDLCLRASWVCRKEKERPFESTFQLRALRHFMRALQEDALIGRELSVTTYLVGELNRRLGNHREALNWYVNAGRTTEGDPRVAWLDRLIDQQSKLAREQAA